MASWKKYLAEGVGTFMLIFFGAGSIMAYETMGGLDIIGVAVAHGLAIMIGVFAFGIISGAHFNPAVTIGLWAMKKVRTQDVPGYVLSQLLGASLGALILKVMFADTLVSGMGIPGLGAGVSPLSGTITEAVLTFLLVWTVFAVAVDQDNKVGMHAGLIIGGVIAADILVGGPLTGGAMNPARWFGPALIGNMWTNWYVYIVGPLVGSLLAATTYTAVYLKKSA